MSLTVGGIQPGYLPWLGYFDQMARVDVFVVADEMPFARSGWSHRNRVLGPNGIAWLRLPAQPERGQQILEVALAQHVPWRRTHLRTLRQAYARSRCGHEEIDALQAAMPDHAGDLIQVVRPTLAHLIRRLRITTPVVWSSDLGLEARYQTGEYGMGATARLVAYLEALGADSLLEGASGRDYLNIEMLRRHGISVAFHEYDHPTYPQRGQPFTSHLSVMDLLAAVGAPEARRVLTR